MEVPFKLLDTVVHCNVLVEFLTLNHTPVTAHNDVWRSQIAQGVLSDVVKLGGFGYCQQLFFCKTF